MIEADDVTDLVGDCPDHIELLADRLGGPLVAGIEDDIGIKEVARRRIDIGDHQGECCRELRARDRAIPDEYVVLIELAPEALAESAVVCAEAGACGRSPLLEGILHHGDHLLLADLSEAVGVVEPCNRHLRPLGGFACVGEDLLVGMGRRQRKEAYQDHKNPEYTMLRGCCNFA